MIFVRIFVLILMLPIFLLMRLLGRRGDMVYLPESHPEMAIAIDEARATLPEFRRLLETPEPGMKDFAVKAKFPVRDGHEHIWVGHLEARGTGFLGKLENHPAQLHGLVLGSAVDVTEEMITDWAYAKDGVYCGHFTTKKLLPHMPKRARRQVEAAYGWGAPKMA